MEAASTPATEANRVTMRCGAVEDSSTRRSSLQLAPFDSTDPGTAITTPFPSWTPHNFHAPSQRQLREMRELASSSSCPPPPPPPPQDDLSSEESSLSSSVIEAMEAAESENDLESLTSNNGITGNQIEEQLTISTDEEEESPYEQLRSENIRSRQEQLQSLGISQPIVASFKPVREKKSKTSSTQPIRKSSRIAGKPPVDEAGSVGL